VGHLRIAFTIALVIGLTPLAASAGPQLPTGRLPLVQAPTGQQEILRSQTDQVNQAISEEARAATKEPRELARLPDPAESLQPGDPDAAALKDTDADAGKK
jgi:hypothetical protein